MFHETRLSSLRAELGNELSAGNIRNEVSCEFLVRMASSSSILRSRAMVEQS